MKQKKIALIMGMALILACPGYIAAKEYEEVVTVAEVDESEEEVEVIINGEEEAEEERVEVMLNEETPEVKKVSVEKRKPFQTGVFEFENLLILAGGCLLLLGGVFTHLRKRAR